jgi:hypothetical protein
MSADGRWFWDEQGRKWLPMVQPLVPGQVDRQARPRLSAPDEDVGQRVGSIGLLLTGAALVAVSAFLDWVTFVIQDFVPTRSQSGFDNGGGLWAIVDATVVAVLAVMLAAGVGGPRGARILIRILWACIVGTTGLGIVTVADVYNSPWVIQGTTTPLTAAPGPGLYLLGVGTIVMLIAIVWVRVLARKGWIPDTPAGVTVRVSRHESDALAAALDAGRTPAPQHHRDPQRKF